MNNVFKSFVKKGLSLAFSSVIAVSCLPLNCSVDNQSSQLANNEQISAEALNFNTRYISYKDFFEFKNKYLAGKNVVSQSYSYKYIFYDNHDKVHRYSDNIPGGENCTIVAVTNFLGYYRRKNGYARWKPRNYYFFYNELESLAREKYRFTEKRGIPFFTDNRNFCQDAFSTYGVFNRNSLSEIKTTYVTTSMCRRALLPKEPFVLSTVTTNHSVYVYGMVTYHLEYRLKNGTRKSEDFDFLQCYDPDGREYMLQTGYITDATVDGHQIMWVGAKNMRI